MDTGSLHIAANGALVFLIAGLAVECVLDHRVSRVAARALVVVTGSVRIDPRAREVVIQSLDHPTVLGDLVLAVRVGEELAAVTAGVVLAVASLGAGGSLGLGLGQLVTQSRQRLVGHGCLGGLISLEHLFADAASVILVIAAFGAGSGNRLNLGQAMPRCLDRLGLCLTAHLAGVGLHAIRGAGGGRSHFTVVPAVLPGGLHIAAPGFGTGGSVFALVGGIGVLGLVDDVMAHGAFLPVIGFVMLPLILVGDHGDRFGLGRLALGAGKGLHASFGAGGGRSHNAGIPRMRSLVHDGAAGELVPVVVIIGCPFDWIIAGPLVVGFLLSHAADLALLRVRGGILYFFFDQLPDMITGSGNDQIGQLIKIGVEIFMADRALIVCLHAVLAAGGGNLSNQVTVLVTGLDDGIVLGDLLCASGILIQLAAGRIATLVVLNVAVLGAGSSLGVHLFQVVGVRGRCHARFNSNVKRNRSARHVIFCVITNQVNGLICHRIGSCGCISGNTISRRNQIFPRSNYSGIIKTIIRPHKLPARNINIVHSLESQDFRRNFSQFQFVRCACFLQRPYSFDSVNFIISGTGPTDGNSPRICTVQNNFSTCHFQFREVCGKCTGADKRQYHRHSQQERNALRENLLHQKCVSFPLLHSSIYHVSAL